MKRILIPILGLALATGCAGIIRPEPAMATASLEAKSGSSVRGTVSFSETMMDGADAVQVTVNASNVPSGLHGFHVHEFGDCSAADASSAGGHFNPTNEAHGGPNSDPSHAGDFGNVAADESNRVSATYVLRGVNLGTGPNSIVGKAIILHEKPDDLVTQPTGNAGGRIACGIITLNRPMP